MGNSEKKAVYGLCPGVRVRREAFGLLFYNSRYNKLTFVKSGSSIEPVCAPTGDIELSILCKNEAEIHRVKHLLRELMKKGIVVEQGSGI
jgi:putative mycofactocin binding protein MftB